MLNFDKVCAAVLLAMGLVITFAAAHPLITASAIDVNFGKLFGVIFICSAGIINAISNANRRPDPPTT